MARKIVERTAKRMAKAGAELALPKSKDFGDRFGYKEFRLSPAQRELEQLIQSHTLVFCKGNAGTGKSTAALYSFVKEYLKDRNKQIIVIRTPAESAGQDTIGYLPSDLNAKIEPHFASVRVILEDLLSKGKVECDLGERIHFKIPNFMLGATLRNAVVLIDEAQQLNPKIMKLLLERIGENTRVVVMGDDSQVYADNKDRNGLSHAISKFFYKDSDDNLIPKYPDVAYFEFGVDSVMRSEMCKTVIRAYSDIPDPSFVKDAQERRLQGLENTYVD